MPEHRPGSPDSSSAGGVGEYYTTASAADSMETLVNLGDALDSVGLDAAWPPPTSSGYGERPSTSGNDDQSSAVIGGPPNPRRILEVCQRAATPTAAEGEAEAFAVQFLDQRVEERLRMLCGNVRLPAPLALNAVSLYKRTLQQSELAVQERDWRRVREDVCRLAVSCLTDLTSRHSELRSLITEPNYDVMSLAVMEFCSHRRQEVLETMRLPQTARSFRVDLRTKTEGPTPAPALADIKFSMLREDGSALSWQSRFPDQSEMDGILNRPGRDVWAAEAAMRSAMDMDATDEESARVGSSRFTTYSTCAQ